MSETRKAKRKLKNFDFATKGSHVALVGKHQGGPANGYTTLLTKATNAIPKTFVEKASKVKVTMTMQEFLRKFFGMYYEDAEILARVLGFDEQESEPDSYEDYIQQKVESVEIMKKLFRAEDISKALSEISEEQFEKLLKDQVMVEKAMSSKVVEAEEGGSIEKNEKTKEDVTKMSDTKEEMIKKSELDVLIEKAVAPLKQELEDAKEVIKAYKQKEAERTTELRKAALKEAVKDDEKVETLMKSFAALSDEDFEATVETLKAVTSAVDSSEMFEEKGVDTEVSKSAASDATRKFLEKRYAENK